MEYSKQIEAVECNKTACPFFSTCAKLPTEVVKTRDEKTINIMFIGQGAGERECKLVRPFVGPAGKVLRGAIKPMMDKNQLNIILDNTIRCRPLDERGKNRKPELNEVEHCIDFVWNRIEEHKPRVIVPVGASAAGDMIPLLRGKPISSTRGKFYEHRGHVFMPTYHPAASLHAGPDRGPELVATMTRDIEKAVAMATRPKMQMELI